MKTQQQVIFIPKVASVFCKQLLQAMHNDQSYHRAYYTCSAAHVASHMSLSPSIRLSVLEIKILHDQSVPWLKMLRLSFDILISDDMAVSTFKQLQAQPSWSQHS